MHVLHSEVEMVLTEKSLDLNRTYLIQNPVETELIVPLFPNGLRQVRKHMKGETTDFVLAVVYSRLCSKL